MQECLYDAGAAPTQTVFQRFLFSPGFVIAIDSWRVGSCFIPGAASRGAVIPLRLKELGV